MIMFRHQPPNFRLNCLSYHKKVLSFSRGEDPPPGVCPQTPGGGSAPIPPPNPLTEILDPPLFDFAQICYEVWSRISRNTRNVQGQG